MEEEEIKLTGPEAWLDKHLETCNYVLIIWSVGARIKSSSKLNANISQKIALLEENHNVNFSEIINDTLFQHAINYILKTAKQDDENSKSKYLNIYFDYSNKNDVSYKFDAFKSFKLMFDIKIFLQHIYLNQNISLILNYLNIIIDEEENNRVKLRQTGSSYDQRHNKRKTKKTKYYNDTQNHSNVTQHLLESTSSNTSAQLEENLISLKLIYIDQFYKQVFNTQNYFKINPNWFENSLFNNNSNKTNSVTSLDSCLLNLNGENNNKLISLSSSSSVTTLPRQNASSSSSLISNSCNNNIKHPYNDFFVHPLPNIDLNYFNLIEEKLNNSTNNSIENNLRNICTVNNILV